MRKGISILFAFVVILSGTHLTLAKHFCGGELVDTRLSLSGKLATCGMASDNERSQSSGIEIKNHCCDNKVSTIGILNNYIPSISFINDNIDIKSISFHLPVNILLCSQTLSYNISSNIRPPGKIPLSSVSLDDICVFRI